MEFLIDYALMTAAFAWMARDARKPWFALATAGLWPLVWLIGVQLMWKEQRLLRRMRRAAPGYDFEITANELLIIQGRERHGNKKSAG